MSTMNREQIMFERFYENRENEKEMFLVEGLICDERRKTVRLTDDTDDGVDFSNKTYLEYKYRFDGKLMTVISIFRRTPMIGKNYKELDGNPFIYALKNDNTTDKQKNEWRFDITDEEIRKYIRRFLEVCDSIDKEYDTIIMVPSSHNINRRFMKVIFERVGAKDKVEDFFYKISKEDAYDSRDLDAISIYCGRKCNYDIKRANQMEERVLDEIDYCFDQMKGEYFQAAKMKKEYLRFIPDIVTRNNKYSLETASKLIRDKRVLVLDDVLSTGLTISSCVKNIRQYGPKSIHVITLLSNKQK